MQRRKLERAQRRLAKKRPEEILEMKNQGKLGLSVAWKTLNADGEITGEGC